jgi:outer membrane autotransporter protein
VNGTSDRQTTTLTHVGTYGRYVDGKTRIDGAIAYSHADHEAVRAITDGATLVSTASASHGNGLALQIEYGRSLDVSPAFALEPIAGLQFGGFRQDGFTEHGGGVLALAVPAHTANSGRTLIGSRAAYVPRPWMMIEARGAWAHEFQRLDDVQVRFAADPHATRFAISPSTDVRDSAVLGLAFDAEAWSRVRFFADFGGEVGGVGRLWSGTFGVTRSW